MTYRPRFDDLSFIPGSNVPETTMIDNYAERHNSLDKPSIYRLRISQTLIDTHNVQINSPCQSNIAPMLGLSHWFYGGEFTIPENNIDVIGSGSYFSGYLKNNNQNQYYKFNYKNPDTLKKSGLPKDILQGDIGYYTCDGYSFGILNGGPSFISAGPFASIECYDMNSTVKINAFHYITNTAITKKYPTCDNLENWRDVDKTSEIEEWTNKYKIIKGYNGPYITSSAEKFYSNIALNGSYFLSSSTEHISNVGKIPSIEKSRTQPLISDFKWKKYPIAQETNYIADMYKNQYGKYDITEKDFSSESLIHQRQDGSICIINKTGSCIEMTADGDIVISPKRDLIFQPGRNMVGVVGNTIDLISKNSCLLRSNTQNIQLTGNNINLISKEELNIRNNKTSLIATDYNHKTTNDIYNVTNSQRKTNSNIEKHNTNIISGTTLLSNFGEIRSSCNIKNERIVNSYNIQTQQYSLGSERFSIYGASSGNISGENPINIYHVHLRGFNYVRCGIAGNCKVISIESDKPSVTVPNIQEINATSPDTITEPTIETEYSSDSTIYKIGWQQLMTDGGSNWLTLENDLKKNIYVDEENEISKSSYKLP